MTTQREPLRVAVIGGGVSGLSMAYYLLEQQQPGDRPVEVDIYERKSTLGGNADTVVVDLGDYIDPQGGRTAYLRWADLGVNDVNLATYVELKNVLGTIGYLDNLKPLQDTECYFNHDGSLSMTDDSALRGGVSNPAFDLFYVDGGRLNKLVKVVHRTAFDRLDQGVKPQYTVGDFFEDCLADPKGTLGAAAEELDIRIDWNDPELPARVCKVRDAIYYPRISAMYFTDERGPDTLPLQSPFAYYQLQEGKNQPPDRRYFAHGAQKWLEALADYVERNSTAQVSVRIHRDTPATVEIQPGRVAVTPRGAAAVPYDLCMLATHADDTLALLNFGAPLRDESSRIAGILSKVHYTTGYAVCHTHAGVMPKNQNVWRTYNVLQRDGGDTVFPYRMSYVGNLHQNDPANPDYAQAGLPLFLISMVSSLNEIPVQSMLDRVQDTSRIGPAMLAALPQATQRQLQGEPLRTNASLARVHPDLADKAWTVFKHNVLDVSCIEAQDAIDAFNQEVAGQIAAGAAPACPLLFGGGWTIGAGLHEQCLLQSAQLAQALIPALRGR